MILEYELVDCARILSAELQTGYLHLTVFLEDLALALGDTFNPAMFDLLAGAEETLPASDRVRADERAVRGDFQFIRS